MTRIARLLVVVVCFVVCDSVNLKVTEIPTLGEGDGTMFDPEIIEVCEQWATPIAYMSRDVRWTGKSSWRVINDMTDEVIFVGDEIQCLLVMASLNVWWDRAPVEARVLFVYGYTEAAEKADSLYQTKVKAMQDDFESFMSTINSERR